MPDVGKRQVKLSKELTYLRQHIVELEQCQIHYQERLTELKLKLAAAKNSYLQWHRQQQEISQQWQTELLESEERLRLAIETARMGFWDWDIVNNQLIWSTNHEILFGLTPGSFTGDYQTFLSYVHPEDQISVGQVMNYALTQKVDYSHEFRIVWPDQSVHWILSEGRFIYNPQGQSMRMIGVCMEISDRKEAEENSRNLAIQMQEQANILNAILSATVDHIFIFNYAGYYLYASHGGAAIFGLRPEEFRGKNLRDLDLPTNFVEQLEKQRLAVITTGQSVKDEYEYGLADGVHYYECILTPLRDLNQTIDGAIAIFRDITIYKQAQAEREGFLERERAARQQAEIANQLKDQFLAVLSHELRTPLNPIIGWSKLLQSRKFDEKTAHMALETIERNAKLQRQLIEDLLDVSCILQGKLNLDASPVDLVMVIEAALETVHLAAQAKSIQIQTIFYPQLGVVMGDANRLQQVVWNLLSNAVKFTPPGGRVEIWLEEVDSQAQIQISDTGQGITPDFIPYVFDDFRQADGTTTRKFGGLGLGLAIVRRVVELHGGTVEVTSLGEELGATFTVRLPYTKEYDRNY
jgi:PAS domain S-box-containing protein